VEQICPHCLEQNLVETQVCRFCGANLTPQTLPVGFRLANQYEIVRVLGQGGFGITYLAANEPNGSVVAIKEFFPTGAVSRQANQRLEATSGGEEDFKRGKLDFYREAALLQTLQHPSIIEVHQTLTANNTIYLVMAYLDGETLEQRIQSGVLLNESEAREHMVVLLDALETLHAKNLLHRDIKPANIILQEDHPVLIDFGSAMRFELGERKTISRRLVTPEYAPLEQFSSHAALSPATDLYALAATFFEALTGKRPTDALSRASGAPLQKLRDLEPAVSVGFANALEQTLAMRIQDRPKSAQALRQSLGLKLGRQFATPTNKVLDDFEVEYVPLTPAEIAEKEAQWSYSFFAGIGALLLLISPFVLIFMLIYLRTVLSYADITRKVSEKNLFAKTQVKVKLIKFSYSKGISIEKIEFFDIKSKKDFSYSIFIPKSEIRINNVEKKQIEIFDIKLSEGDVISLFLGKQSDYYFNIKEERRIYNEGFQVSLFMFFLCVLLLIFFFLCVFQLNRIEKKYPHIHFSSQPKKSP
jgi:serine/threonine protein kinase